MKSVVFILLLMSSLTCSAGEWLIHTYAHHFKVHSLNKETYGVGYKRENILAGGFINSYKDVSLYLVKEKDIYKNTLTLTYGGVTGYDKYPILPMANLNLYVDKLVFTFSKGIEDSVVLMSFRLH